MTDSVALAKREVEGMGSTLARMGASVMSDDEMRRLFRLADGLYQSGVYGDLEKAGQAFAKLLVGQTLGMTPAQAMAGVQFVKGNVQMHYRALGAFVRENGYDFKLPQGLADVTDEGLVVAADAEHPAQPNPNNKWAVIDFYGPRDEDGEREFLGRSTFTAHDADVAGVNKPSQRGEPSNYFKYPRNMHVARAMSNGIGWFCPEVMRGIPVYVPGEVPEPVALLEEGSSEPQGIDLGPKVDAVLERAAALGHAGLANRESVEMQLGRAAPATAVEWVRWATGELDAFEAKQKAGATTTGPQDAEVVDGVPEVPVDSTDLPEPGAQARAEAEASEGDGGEPEEGGAPVVETGGAASPSEEPAAGVAEADGATEGPDVVALRRKLSDLMDRQADLDAQGEVDPATQERLDAEVKVAEDKLRAAGGDVPGQERLM